MSVHSILLVVALLVLASPAAGQEGEEPVPAGGDTGAGWETVPPSEWTRQPRNDVLELDEWGRVVGAWGCVHFEVYDAWGLWYTGVTGRVPETEFCGYLSMTNYAPPPGVDTPARREWSCIEAPNVFIYTVPFNGDICGFFSAGRAGTGLFFTPDESLYGSNDQFTMEYLAKLGQHPLTEEAVNELGLDLPNPFDPGGGDAASGPPWTLLGGIGLGIAGLTGLLNRRRNRGDALGSEPEIGNDLWRGAKVIKKGYGVAKLPAKASAVARSWELSRESAEAYKQARVMTEDSTFDWRDSLGRLREGANKRSQAQRLLTDQFGQVPKGVASSVFKGMDAIDVLAGPPEIGNGDPAAWLRYEGKVLSVASVGFAQRGQVLPAAATGLASTAISTADLFTDGLAWAIRSGIGAK